MSAEIGIYLWLGLTILFGLIEAATVGLTSIWFAAGALVAALAALRASEAEKSALLADVARMEEKQDRPSLMALGYAFHQRLAQLCCNPVLAGFYQSAAGQLRCMRVLESLTLEVYLGDIAEHRRIAEAVAAGDAVLAAERMREHLRRDYGAYLTELTALR